MSTVQSLQQQISALPPAARQELEGFLHTLTDKYALLRQEDHAWADFSISSAMQGMEDEETPYTMADVKERW